MNSWKNWWWHKIENDIIETLMEISLMEDSLVVEKRLTAKLIKNWFPVKLIQFNHKYPFYKYFLNSVVIDSNRNWCFQLQTVETVFQFPWFTGNEVKLTLLYQFLSELSLNTSEYTSWPSERIQQKLITIKTVLDWPKQFTKQS